MNKGYEDRGNRHPGGGSTSSAPQVLYDTAQTGNRGAVKGAPVTHYAVVDKSKKKPKLCIWLSKTDYNFLKTLKKL